MEELGYELIQPPPEYTAPRGPGIFKNFLEKFATALKENITSQIPPDYTNIEVVIAKTCKDDTSIEAMCNFVNRFHDGNAYQACLVQQLPMIDRNAKWGAKIETVKKLARLEANTLNGLVARELRQIVPVTPFNFMHTLAAHPGVQISKLTGTTILYDNMELDLSNVEKSYSQACAIIMGKGMQRRQEFKIYDWKDGNICAAKLLAMYCDIDVDDVSITFTPKANLEAPPGAKSDVQELGATLYGIIATLFSNMRTYNIRDLPQQDILSAVYVLLNDYDFSKNEHMEALKGFEDYFNEFTKGSYTVHNNIDDRFEEEMLDAMAVSQVDTYFNVVKENLERSRVWRMTCPVLDGYSHDLMNEQRVTHLPENKWGVIHQILMLLQKRDVYSSFSVEKMVIYGPGSDKLARAVNALQKERGYFSKNGKVVPRTIVGPGSLEAVKDVIVIPHEDIDRKTFDITRYCEKGTLLLISSFSENESSDVHQNILDVYNRLNNKEVVIMIATNLMTSRTLDEIHSAAWQNGFSLDLWKHSRLHNDAVYYISVPSKVQSDRIVLEKLRLRYLRWCMLNNDIRNVAMYLGQVPINTRCVDENFAMAIYIAYRQTDDKKNVVTGTRQKLDASSEIMRRLELRRTKANNNFTPNVEAMAVDNNATDKGGDDSGKLGSPGAKKKRSTSTGSKRGSRD